MGIKDASIKSWLRDSKRFADLFNGIIFGGKQVILPEKLEEINSESNIVLTDKNNKLKAVERYRDIIMRWSDNVYLVLLALEVQDKIHYAMPVRKMLYDALSYTDQMRNIWQNLSDDAPEKQIENGSFDISKCNLIAYANGRILCFRKENWKIWIFCKKEEKIMKKFA